MKKVTALGLFFLFVVALMVSGALHAQNNPNNIYGSCGSKPNVLENLFTNAEKIRQKCIEDAYELNKEKTRKKIEELANTSDKLGAELKKVATQNALIDNY